MNLHHARSIAYGQSTKFDQDGCSCDVSGSEENLSLCHDIPCESCNMPHGSCIKPPKNNMPNLRGVMVGRLARDNPAALADVDRYFYGETTNPCNSRRELMEKYIKFIERIYPRRCCDEDEVISSKMVMDMKQPIFHNRQCCFICQEFSVDYTSDFDEIEIQLQKEDIHTNHNTTDHKDSRRRKRHVQKYGKAKVVSGIVDSAIQPTLGILFGQRGNSQFRRELHRLSRDMSVRNCGPAYILRKAMAAIPQEVWDRPFALNETTNYIPSR